MAALQTVIKTNSSYMNDGHDTLETFTKSKMDVTEIKKYTGPLCVMVGVMASPGSRLS